MSIAFDTLKLADRLAAGGFTGEQAKTASAALSEALTDSVLTKADLVQAPARHDNAIEAVRSDLERAIETVRSDLEHAIAALGARLDTRIDALDAKIDTLELRLTVKLGAMLVVAVGAIGVLIRMSH